MLWKPLLIGLTAALLLPAQEDTETPLLVNPTIPEETEEEEEEGPSASDASIFNEGMARTMTISIPAPRGLILDREGRPLAQSKMAYHLALDFTAYKGPADSQSAVAWAHQKVTAANTLIDGDQTYSDKKLATYYRHRRWLPRKISQILTEEKAKSLEGNLPVGLTLLPVYQRFYPEKTVAAHLIGYVGAQTVLPSGPINEGDPLFQSVMGKSGFEKIFDQKLRGEPGLKKMIFDKNGTKVLDEAIRRPRPGGNVVTTIDLDWQRYAERVLREGSKRGAFVVIDIQTGEVLVMASRPTFDLNEFVPYITQDRLDELYNDPASPLFSRAYQSKYPPASTFKPVVTLAAISNGAIRYDQKFDCPDKIKIGKIYMRNHSPGHQGWVEAKRALAKSINPWFYQVGIETGPQGFLSVARRLGYGSKTGLPLLGETAGVAPTPDYITKKTGRTTTDGDTANLAIGQGLMEASPLQVAQAMAAIGNGSVLMELQLVRQIQDFHGRVIEAPTFKKRNELSLSPIALKTTQEGMRDVVHASYGTGKRADLGFTIMCGKTGTAQWGPKSKNQNLAWFSGFFPFENPRYAFAVVYEGVPGESVSGGRKAAPMVKRFFRNFRTEIQENLKPAARAQVVSENEEVSQDTIPLAILVEDDEFPLEEPYSPTPGEPETPADIPAPEPEAPGDIPRAEPVIPTVPGEDIPEAIPVKPEEPEAPTDLPKAEPVAPGDE
ncbi:MAG: penicillin-binding protein 2 [Paracoccaceae bacterium]|jgi:penicillin-binding protein 2